MGQPPLPARMRPAHWTALDALAAAAYAGLLAGYVLPRLLRGHTALPVGAAGLPAWLDCVAILLTAAPVAIRRRWPLAALGLAASGTILGMIGGLRQAPFPALAYVLYYVAVSRPRRVATSGLALALASALAAFAASSGLTALSPAGSATALPSVLFTLLTQAAAWLIGRTAAQQRAYSRGLAEQAASRAAAEIGAARAVVTEQRLQMARDLHDVVAHSVSLMTVQAGAARMLADTQPAQTRQLLGAIETTGRDCLREARRVLGVLRDEHGAAAGPEAARGDGGALLPGPGIDQLPELIARSAAAGVKVATADEGVPADLPATIGVTAYRIIQEALTNVIRHSSADRCRVCLSYRPGELSIRVTNALSGPRTAPPPPPGAGYGLIGMRERVALHGGTFSAGRDPGAGFTLIAILPLPGVSA